jgi:polysaccharide biosynthesis/export protein
MKHRLAALTLACAGVMCAVHVFAQTQTSTPPPANTPPATGLQPLTAVGTPANVTVAPLPKAAAAPLKTGAAPLPMKADPRSAEMSTAYQIGPEDLLDISVWKNVELSRVVPVRPDGKVSLPLVNDIQAAGLTPTELRDQITTKLAEYIPAPEVSVMVREVHSRKVAVVGAVKMPGRYEMKSPMTVLEAIALAQGLTDFASRDRIVVLRDVSGKTTQIPFNYRKIGDDGASQQNFFLRPGDIVVVP